MENLHIKTAAENRRIREIAKNAAALLSIFFVAVFLGLGALFLKLIYVFQDYLGFFIFPLFLMIPLGLAFSLKLPMKFSNAIHLLVKQSEDFDRLKDTKL